MSTPLTRYGADAWPLCRVLFVECAFGPDHLLAHQQHPHHRPTSVLEEGSGVRMGIGTNATVTHPRELCWAQARLEYQTRSYMKITERFRRACVAGVAAQRQRSLCAGTLTCYTEKAPNAWQRRGTQKTRNTYNQPNRPNRQTSLTKHHALPKRQPGRRRTPINTAVVHASAQQQPTISTHTRQGHHQIFSANAARCEAQEQYRRGG